MARTESKPVAEPLAQQPIGDAVLPSPAQVLNLQHLAGNSAVSRLIQTKLTVGAAGDCYEQEADRVAAQVMNMSAPMPTQPAVQRAPEEEEELQMKPLAASITPLVQRAAVEEAEVQLKPIVQRVAEEEEELQAKPDIQRSLHGAGFEISGAFEQQLSATRGGGRPLPDPVRDFMEPRFGADFSGVRIHTGGQSAQLNRSVSAQAFTLGQDIYLGEGKTDLESSAGKSLLAHELTHVVQQTGSVRPSVQRWSMGAKGEGHEILTRESLRKAGFTEEEIQEQFGGREGFVEGSKWNDLPGGYGAASAIVGIGPKTAITYRSHNQDMQFLHGMAMAEQKASQTVDYMLAWAEFCYAIAQGRITKDAVLSKVPVPLIQGLFPAKDYEGKQVSWLFMVNDDARLKAVAMGSLLHMIQDTFCAAHTQRARKKSGESGYGKIRAFQDYGAQDHGRHGKADVVTKGETDAKRVEASVSADDAVQTGAMVLTYLKAGAPWLVVKSYLLGEVFVLEQGAADRTAKATRHFRQSAHEQFKKKLPFYFTWSAELRRVVNNSQTYDALLEYKSNVGIQYKSEMVAVKNVLTAIADWRGSKYATDTSLKGEAKATTAINWLESVMRQDESDIALDLTQAEQEQLAAGQ